MIENLNKKCFNRNLTCLNCPAARFKKEDLRKSNKENILIRCSRRPELGKFRPNITFEECPQWIFNENFNLYILKNMKVMILGIDGYLGWTLALKLANLGFYVSGVDNYLRRDCVKEKGSHSVIPISTMTERLHAAKEVFGVTINFRNIDINDRIKLKQFLEEEKPEAIVHYAEIPSAPYSMVDAEHAIKTQSNNILGTLGLLYLMKDITPESNLIKLGTMGEYGTPLSGRPIFEGYFPREAMLKWKDREWSLEGELIPRDPGSFYHLSKVHDTYNIYKTCKWWGLRSYDIMQGVIYGVHTDEVAADPRLRTRLDIDEWYGTVVNRFVAQAIIGIPLTIYGKGDQIRGYLALEDAMECMLRLISTPPLPGEYVVVNQVASLYKIKDIAETVARVGNEKFGLNVKIQKVENPRIEAEEHPYEVISTKLPARGFKPKISLEKEIIRMFELLTKPEIKLRIEEKKHVILPRTRWDGTFRESKQIEECREDTKNKEYRGNLYIEE